MTDTTDIPTVSMANTKKELLEAYETAKNRLDTLNKGLLDAEKARKRLEKQVAEATAKQRQREKEEHEYASAREHAQRKNALEDELQALEKELAVKRNDFENDVRQRTAALDTREEAITGRENEMAALQKEVKDFPARSEASVQTATAQTTDRLTRDFKSDKALMEARFDGEKNVLLGKIEALEKVVSSQAAQIADLSKKSELAYEKVQDIANRAVTASRREPYPAPVHHSAASGRDDSQALK
jgi:hypothetical protein